MLKHLRLGILLFAVATAPAGADEAAAVIDLTTRDGVALAGGAWRYSEVTLVPVEHRAADAAGQPTGPVTATWDISPHAGTRDYDDSAWPVLDPSTLAARRGNGRLSFNWYRINVQVPPRVGTFDTRGARLEFETSLDDYAEVWVDGELPRATGQSGGPVIAGWNATNRLTIARNVQP
ncbi:MAG: hypothetical protein OEW72_07255, partial [Gammaproteobacteria bacterium]|nr:hypothetical protein [Gammaproteobacteria bacterium]